MPEVSAMDMQYSFSALPESPDGQVRATIQRMIQFARADSEHPAVSNLAQKAITVGHGDPNIGLWRVIKPAMVFKKDEQIADQSGIGDIRIPDTVEVLIRPADQAYFMERYGSGVGDCDCFAMLGAAILLSLGIPCSFVTVAVDPDQPGRFSHVYLASFWQGQRCALDLSHGEYPGWECPNLGRLKEWPVNERLEWTTAALTVGALAGVYVGLKYFGGAA